MNLVAAASGRMVALYPDSIEAWTWLKFYEGWLAVETDSTRGVHRRKLALFGARARESGRIDAEQLGRVYWYARMLNDSATTAVWRGRLFGEAPTSPFAIQERLLDLMSRLAQSHDSVSALRQADALWTEAPTGRRAQVANLVVGIVPPRAAFREELTRWIDRATGDASGVAAAEARATALLRIPETREEGMRVLESTLARAADKRWYSRALNENRRQFLTRIDVRGRALAAKLGRAYERHGDHARALAVLTPAIESGWSPDAFDAYASAAAATGDTARALPLWARVAVDPRTSNDRRSLLDATGTAHIGDAAWRAMLDSAHARLSRVVLAGASSQRVPEAALYSANGAPVPLSSLTRGAPTVVVFWSVECGPALEMLPKLAEAMPRLRMKGVRVLTISEQPANDSRVRVAMKKADLTASVYFDPTGGATQAFNNFGTPNMFLLDTNGHALFAGTSSMDELLLRVEAVAGSR